MLTYGTETVGTSSDDSSGEEEDDEEENRDSGKRRTFKTALSEPPQSVLASLLESCCPNP